MIDATRIVSSCTFKNAFNTSLNESIELRCSNLRVGKLLIDNGLHAGVDFFGYGYRQCFEKFFNGLLESIGFSSSFFR